MNCRITNDERYKRDETPVGSARTMYSCYWRLEQNLSIHCEDVCAKQVASKRGKGIGRSQEVTDGGQEQQEQKPHIPKRRRHNASLIRSAFSASLVAETVRCITRLNDVQARYVTRNRKQ